MLIQSLLDNDKYKFTMQQALLKLGFASVPVEYKFKDRNNFDYTNYYTQIVEEIEKLKRLFLTNEEMNFLKSLNLFSEEYLLFLKYFRFDPSLVKVNIDKNGQLDIRIKGPWFQTILFEIPILSIISEIRSERKAMPDLAINIFKQKIQGIIPKDFKFADFCTRRRASFDVQENLIFFCKECIPSNFVGTSNMYFAMKYNIKSIGTMAHEWLQAHQQLGYRIVDSQKMAFENWIKVYRGNLGIALSDVINTHAFLKDFDDPLFYKLFDGVREDSEPEPITFGQKMISFYYKRKIDPKTKTIIFSNSLSFQKAFEIHRTFYGTIGISFGIGTNFGNDCGIKPPNIVLKMVKCNGQDVAKISNAPGKEMCENPEYVNYLKSVYEVIS